MKVSSRENILSVLRYALIGGVLAAFYFVWLENESPVHGLRLPFILLYLWVFFGIAAYLVWTRVLKARLALYSMRWKGWWLGVSLVMGFWLSDNIPVVLPVTGGVLRLVLFVCAGAGLGLLLFTASVLLVTRFRPPLAVTPRRLRWLVYALPMLAAWVICLLAFWPGMMSLDSLDQWAQVLSGRFQDHHPAFHTFTIWLLTRVALTPAVVALAQIIALALVTGAILAYIETLGVSPRWLWIASLIFAISPVNGTMVNTLWKDVPYSTVMLALTYLILRLVTSQGRWLEHWSAWVLLGITAALAGLFRHNGLAVSAAAIVLLLVVYRQQWKPLAAALALCVALYYGITGPVYQLVGVEKSAQLSEAAATMYTLAANADPGSATDQILRSMNPVSNSWQCIPIYGALHNASAAEVDQPESLPVKALNLLEHSPSLLAYDYRCNRSLMWIIWDPNGEVRNPSHAEYWIDANAYGITPDSKIPALRLLLSMFVARTAHDTGLNWLVWRPALYLYGFLFVVAVIALRQKNPRLLLIAAPVLLQSVSATLISMLPNFRYHYFLYLAALAFWPLLFLPFRPAGGEQLEAGSQPTDGLKS